MKISTFGAILGLVLAIILIIKKIQPVYSLMLGALVGGIVGGADLAHTVEYMINGASGIAPSILRVLASGVLAGSLIKTGAVDRISEKIIEFLGEKKAILGIALSTMVLAAVGVNLDVAVITVAPVALYIGRKLNYSKMAILLAMLGGGKCGNIISPNPNTLAAADSFSIELSNIMMANILPAIVGLAVTTLIANIIVNKGSKINDNDIVEQREDLPSLGASIVGPVVSILLLFLGNISSIVIDPLIALPIGGIAGLIATNNFMQINEAISFGLSKMQGVCILLLGTGTMAGIIQMSGIQDSTIVLLDMLNIPQFLLAPISAIFMSFATASTTAGATIASSTFASTIVEGGISPIGGGAMINSGASVFEQLPHGSLFHTSSDSVSIIIKERIKLLPYEIFIGLIITLASTIIHIK